MVHTTQVIYSALALILWDSLKPQVMYICIVSNMYPIGKVRIQYVWY